MDPLAYVGLEGIRWKTDLNFEDVGDHDTKDTAKIQSEKARQYPAWRDPTQPLSHGLGGIRLGRMGY